MTLKITTLVLQRQPSANGLAFVLNLSLPWRHNEHNGVSNHQPHDFLLNRLFRRRSKQTSKLRVTGLCAGNSPVTGEFPAQRSNNAENVSIWWCNHSEHTDVFACDKISPSWCGVGCLHRFLRNGRICLSYTVNTMLVDGLLCQGARASATMVLT